MAKDVKFNIKLQIDGKDHVVAASTDVKELAEQLKISQKAVFHSAAAHPPSLGQNSPGAGQNKTSHRGKIPQAAGRKDEQEGRLKIAVFVYVIGIFNSSSSAFM
ncbi:MAG: hypothetical protein ACOYJE_00460 [Bacteroidaceae bacterium]|jgi:hypothetical protein